MLLFWIFAAISTIFFNDQSPQRNIITFLAFVLFYIISTAIIYTTKSLKFLINSYISISVLSSVDIIWNFLNDYAYAWNRYSLDIFGVYRDPNYVSAFIIPAIGIILYHLFLKGTSIKFTNTSVFINFNYDIWYFLHWL